MNSTFYSKIEHTFTKSRLSVYRQDGVDDATALARYLYNVELCKTLYTVLNIFEITLRNRVSHYERIIHWKDLLSQHEQLLECIKWLDGESFSLVSEINMFDYIYSAGVNPFVVLVNKKWN